MLIFTALLLAQTETTVFPERAPILMEACFTEAAAEGDVTETEDSLKYICAGDAAVQLWEFLERAKIEPYDQDTPEGVWSSRGFPLGGCFKRLRMPDGKPASDGLSCSIWIPRPATKP